MKRKILSTLTVFCSLFMINVGLAADQTFRVVDQDDNLVEHVVISLHKAGEPYQPQSGMTAIMAQKGQTFQPFVLPVARGTRVTFPNFDDFRHHVYSFSAPKRFEIKLYGGDEEKSEVFDKVGTVALGCNIHDDMLAYIQVVDSSLFAKTNAQGEAMIAAVNAGEYEANVWHPRQMRNDPQASQSVTITDAGDMVTLKISIKSPRAKRRAHTYDE